MCKVTGDYITTKEFTGYKIVIVGKDGNYYSPYTGMKYTIGKVEPVSVSIISRKTKHYCTMAGLSVTNDMKGMTGVFCDWSDAECILQVFNTQYKKYKFLMVKMTITGNLKRASMGWFCFDTIIGNEITDINI